MNPPCPDIYFQTLCFGRAKLLLSRQTRSDVLRHTLVFGYFIYGSAGASPSHAQYTFLAATVCSFGGSLAFPIRNNATNHKEEMPYGD